MSSGGGNKATGGPDFSKYSPEELKNMSPETRNKLWQVNPEKEKLRRCMIGIEHLSLSKTAILTCMYEYLGLLS